jgi:hypothetical protein
MSAAVQTVELLLEQLPREDRSGYFEELPASVRDAFWRELGDEAAEHSEAQRIGEQDRYGWHRRPRVGQLWNVRKYPRRPRLRVVEGGRQDHPDGDVLHEIAPCVYVEALACVQVPVHGRIRCPLPGHDDRTPSFKVYDSPAGGWCCFGCHAGGDIYSFAALLWGMDARRDFPELRRRIAAELLGHVAA